MATRNIVPRATGEGGIGTSSKKWGSAHFDTITADTFIGIPASGGGANKRVFSPANMRLDDINTGSDADTVFGIIDTVSFDTATDGSVWMTMDFNENDFAIDEDLDIDLTHVFDGDSSGTQVVRLTIEAWVADVGEAPVSGSPTTTVTSDVNVTEATDNSIQETTSFITIPNANLNSNTRTVSFKITRDQDHANDTYGGTYHVVKVVAGQ